MEKYKIAVVSGKGGVGKSMICSYLSYLFSKEMKIVVVDGDVDCPNLHLWFGDKNPWEKEERISVSEKAMIEKDKCKGYGKCLKICQFGAVDIKDGRYVVNSFFCEGCGACEMVCPEKAIRLEKVLNGRIRESSKFGFKFFGGKLEEGESGSGKVVSYIKEKADREDYQLMMIDGPAGVDCPVIASINDANYVVLVTEPTVAGFSDLKKILVVVKYFGIEWGVVINRCDIDEEYFEKIKEFCGDKFLGKVGFDKRVYDLSAQLKSIAESNLEVKDEIEKVYERVKEDLDIQL